ncbi:uncharacterized protein LOC142241012 [Haematobia irritans]|uniref:uncharacterized protein LOC142241012 n=1 Tax=Haematobia irritans TaxID=7368 RepID=UPI003F509C5D
MSLDILKKQCVIIGSFAIVVSLLLIWNEVMHLQLNLRWKHMEETSRTKYINRNIVNFAIYGAGVVASLLLILGACKRRHLLLVPLMICVLAAIACTIFFIGFNLVTLPFAHIEFLANYLPVLGLESLFFNILYSTFNEIKKEKSQQPNNRIHYDAI